MSVKLKGSEAFQHIQLDVLKGTISRLPLVSFSVASFMNTLIDMSESRFAEVAQTKWEYLRWFPPILSLATKNVSRNVNPKKAQPLNLDPKNGGQKWCNWSLQNAQKS